MAEDSKDPKDTSSEEPQVPAAAPEVLPALSAELASAPEEPAQAATELGVDRYVHAAFFVVGILTSFLGSQVILALWNYLAEIPSAVQAVPLLIEFTEDQRGTYCLIVGAVVGVGLVLRYYRRPAVRGWAFEVARELGRVTWPNQETVTSGTVVVIIASVIATIYVSLLDRFWGYLTNLVYGA
jgi:preprotein translocase subunit SecE